MNKLKSVVGLIIVGAVVLLGMLTFSPVANANAIDGNWSSASNITTATIEGDWIYISTPQQLSWFNQNKNNEQYRRKNVKLMANIDLSAHYWSPTYDSSSLDKNWGAIFDGNGYKITGLTTSESGTEVYAGLFSYTYYGTTIKNISFENCTISGSHEGSGIVAGYFDGTTITGCYFTGCSLNVTITNSGWKAAGGIVGFAHASNISLCHMSNLQIAATGTTSSVGGIIGYQYNSNVSTCCVSLHTNGIVVTGTTNYVGGVTGDLYNTAPDSNNDGSINSSDTKYKVEKSYCEDGKIESGTIDSTTSTAGGIVGIMGAGCSIENCFNTSNISSNAKNESTKTDMDLTLDGQDSSGRVKISGTSGLGTYYLVEQTYVDSSKKSTKTIYDRKAYAGGICGYSAANTTISYCYNTGTISKLGYYEIYYSYKFAIIKNKSEHSSYSAGVSSDYYYYSGGICGYNGSTVTSCYNNEFNNKNSRSGGYDSSYCYRATYPLIGDRTIYCYKYDPSLTTNSSGHYVNFTLNVAIGSGKTSLANFGDGDSMSSYDSFIEYGTGKKCFSSTISYTTNNSYTSSNTTIADIKDANSAVWVIDAGLNGGNPTIRDFYWKYSVQEPK